MAFKYQPRSKEEWERRAQRGSNYEGFVKNEYNTFTPKRGENSIRILPPTWRDAKHYGVDVWVHYQVGPEKASVLCLQRMENKPCPICEARVRADRDGDEETAREMRATHRVLTWIIDRSDERRGPLLWAIPHTFDTSIAKAARDRVSGETFQIDHPEQGYDLIFDREGENRLTKYDGEQISRRPNAVPAGVLDYIDANPVPKTLVHRTYDEILALFQGYGATPKGDEGGLRRRRMEDDDEEPRRRRVREDDEQPRRRRVQDEDDEQPRRKRMSEDDEADAPRRRSQDRDPPWDDDDDRTRRAKREEDEDETRATLRNRNRREEPEEEQDRPVRRQRPAAEEPEEDEPPREKAAVKGNGDDRPRRLRAVDDEEEAPIERSRRRAAEIRDKLQDR